MLDLAHIESFYPPVLRPFKRNLLREYLQYKILEQIFSSPWAGKLAFMGGTAIHLIHGNTRFSEELDFDNRGMDGASFRELGAFLVKALARQGYDADVKAVVKSAFHLHVRFLRVLFDTGISRHRDEVLIVQVDAEPQNYSYVPEKVLLSRFDVFTRVAAVPAGLLVAQKITCLFTRKRPLGRDAYDIVYLMGKAVPDMAYLRLKLGIVDKADLKAKLLGRCAEIDFRQCARDVGPFLFTPEDSKKVERFAEWVTTVF
ncbi:MAG: nucleotidyl transferase AbiEii/AbiGii toxin family protein [Chitinispirillaceae bacterium]|nr:nucleotidyl transferase AbiEii/AbiGii toxin family protein [Chitinispirillaceae bacterium]